MVAVGNVIVSIATAPELASPMTRVVAPAISANSASEILSVPAPPPIPIVAELVFCLTVRVPVVCNELLPVLSVIAIPSAIMVIALAPANRSTSL